MVNTNNNAVSKLNNIILGENVESALLLSTLFLCELIPEMYDMIGFEQNNPHHHLDVWQHTMAAVSSTPNDMVLRLTMLLHDIGKPHCYTEDERGGHFYGHPQVSMDMAREILLRLGYDNGTIESVTQLVLYHDADIQPRKKHLKRWINKIGEERLWQLIEVKRADANAQSETFRQIKLLKLDAVSQMIDGIIEEQRLFSLKDLAVNGKDLIEVGVPQGTIIGGILNRLKDMVVNGVVDNDKAKLLSITSQLLNEYEPMKVNATNKDDSQK